MVRSLAPTARDRAPSPGLTLYKAAMTSPLPTRDDILSLLLHPTTTPTDLQAIMSFLHAARAVAHLPSYTALQLSDTAPRHCVRCHAPYTDAANTHGACVVPHVFNSHEYIWLQGNLYATAGCCRRIERFVSTIGDGDGARARLVQVGTGACYRGYHTEDTDEVEVEGGYNGVNLRRCDDGPVCMQEELLKLTIDRPLFADFGAIEPLRPFQPA